MAGATPGQLAYKLAFQLSPIVMTGGMAINIPGGMLPIIALTQPLQLVGGLISGSLDLELDDAFANFRPMAGGTLVENDIGRYPFANQAVAANAIIAKPLQLSMLMLCPARDFAGYATKLATMMALQAAVAQHVALGGTFTVLTPARFYTNGILLALRDVTGGESKQAQAAFQWDFEFPLLTIEQAQAAQNSLMSKLTSATQVQGQPAWSSPAPTLGDPSSLATSSVMPTAANTPAASIAAVNLPPVPGASTEPWGYNVVPPMGTRP